MRYLLSRIAACHKSDGGRHKPEDILRDADIAMYRAKAQGAS